VDRKKKSLGRDVFDGNARKTKSQAVKNMLRSELGKKPAVAKEVPVTVTLTPSNIKHLDVLISELHKAGKGRFTRSHLIRVAITLLSVGDF